MNQRVHTEERPFPCSQCNKWFKTDRERITHEEGVHKEERSEECVKCSKMFKSVKALQNHQASHIEERPFGCEMCKQRFKNLNAVNKHKIIIHSEQKAFSCDQCSKLFALNNQLQRHQRQVHTPKVRREKKKYHCDQCDFVTNEQGSASGLNIHKKNKHMEKVSKGNPQKCHDCPFVSERSWKLYQHKLKTHQTNKI